MAIVRDSYDLDPYSNALFLFCGRGCRKIKALHFDKDGFVLMQKREDETTIVAASAPASLFPHSPASPSLVAMIMYRKAGLYLPFYRQEMDFGMSGVPIPRETQARWFIKGALEYLEQIYSRLHEELLRRDLIHADEVPCQVLHEDDRKATQKSYMWIYQSGSDGKPPVALYEYQPGRASVYPIEFLKGFHGMIQCDGYAAYGCIEDVILICCLAHARRKFFDAVPKGRQKRIRLLQSSVLQGTFV